MIYLLFVLFYYCRRQNLLGKAFEQAAKRTESQYHLDYL